MENSNQKHHIELSTILREGIEEYKKNHTLHPQQEKAINCILSCRTSQLGGHSKVCNNCGVIQQAYNSCRNRHCPKCQFIKQEQWVDKLAHNLLPCKYYHVVFTVPHELHSIMYLNPRHCYALLFQAASQAITKAGANPNFLGAQTGALTILHTWTQTLGYHPHIHMLVPAGGLSEDEMEWIKAGKKFFLPQKVISRIFRGVLVRLIKESIEKGEIKLPDSIRSIESLKTKLYQKEWNVYIKKPFRGITSVLKYLGRYTHRVAISNSRFVSLANGCVSFRYTDNRDNGKRKVMTLDITEFIRRYLQHILPNNFYKIRYVGVLASVNSKTKRQQCNQLLGEQTFYPEVEGLTAMETIEIIKKIDPFLCKQCRKGKLLNIPIDAG